MAYGEHWEWRGFGGVSLHLAKRFLLLPSFSDPHRVKDKYLWIPHLKVNAKLREGLDEGLKFKRKVKEQGRFEVWLEDEDALFEFPLQPDGWEKLTSVFKDVNKNISVSPSFPASREQVIKILRQAGCKIVTVTKERDIRLLEQKEGNILVEWTAIYTPQPCVSIGLECWDDSPSAVLSDAEALKSIKSAYSEFKLSGEPLRPMSYLEAVKQWAAKVRFNESV